MAGILVVTRPLEEDRAEARYLSRGAAARYIGVCVRALDALPIRRIKLGHRTVKYDVHDLDAFMTSRKEDMAA